MPNSVASLAPLQRIVSKTTDTALTENCLVSIIGLENHRVWRPDGDSLKRFRALCDPDFVEDMRLSGPEDVVCRFWSGLFVVFSAYLDAFRRSKSQTRSDRSILHMSLIAHYAIEHAAIEASSPVGAKEANALFERLQRAHIIGDHQALLREFAEFRRVFEVVCHAWTAARGGGEGVDLLPCPKFIRCDELHLLPARLKEAQDGGDLAMVLQILRLWCDLTESFLTDEVAPPDSLMSACLKSLELAVEMLSRAGRRPRPVRVNCVRLLAQHYLALTGFSRLPWSNNGGMRGDWPEFLGRITSSHPARPGSLATRRLFAKLPTSN